MVRRTPRIGKPHFTMMSLHIDNSHAKKRGIAKNVLDAVRTAMQQVDMVAGDFNGAAWRRKRGEGQQCVSTIEEAFADTKLPVPDGPTPLWGPSGVPDEWSDECGRFRNRMTKYACMVLSRSIARFLASSPPTRAAITRFDPLIARHRVAGHS